MDLNGGLSSTPSWITGGHPQNPPKLAVLNGEHGFFGELDMKNSRMNQHVVFWLDNFGCGHSGSALWNTCGCVCRSVYISQGDSIQDDQDVQVCGFHECWQMHAHILRCTYIHVIVLQIQTGHGA